MSEERRIFMDPEDKQVRLIIWWDEAQNAQRTKEAGFPVYDRAIKLAVMTPGSPMQQFSTIVERIDMDGKSDKSDLYYKKYQAQIEMFKAGEKGPEAKGLPLTQWATMDRAMAKTYSAAGIYTVEQLAELEGTQLQGLGIGAQTWKKKAIAHLAQMNSGAEVSRLSNENADLSKRLAELEAIVAQASKKPEKKAAAV